MRIFLYLEDNKPVLQILGFKIRMSDREFDSLFYDAKMLARNMK
jgi:hypothetical protein